MEIWELEETDVWRIIDALHLSRRIIDEQEKEAEGLRATIKGLRITNGKLCDKVDDLECALKEARKQADRIYFKTIDEYAKLTGLKRKQLASIIKSSTDLPFWESIQAMQPSHSPETVEQVKVLHSFRYPCSEIDKRLGLEKGTAHDVIVDMWYEQSGKGA